MTAAPIAFNVSLGHLLAVDTHSDSSINLIRSGKGLAMSVKRVFWLAMVSLCCLVLPLAGQDARGTILGRVTDPVDALIVGAKVEATNVDTGVKLSSVTNRSG